MTDGVGNVHPAFRAFWHPVAWSTEVTTSMLTVTLLDEPLILLRDGAGTVVALADDCPHRGAPLSLGERQGDELVCPFHGWRFGLDGVATCIPSQGADAAIPPRARLARPDGVCERYGIVWVALEPPRAPILDWPDGDDPSLGTFAPEAHTSEILAGYQTDNLLDASHFSFTHRSLQSRYPGKVERHEVLTEDATGFSTVLPHRVLDGEREIEGTFRYACRAPFSVTLRAEVEGRMRRSFFQAVQPVDERRTRLFFLVRVSQTDPGELAALLAVAEEVQREDLRITAAQRRRVLDLSDQVDLHVRADRNGVLYRRMLRNLLSA